MKELWCVLCHSFHRRDIHCIDASERPSITVSDKDFVAAMKAQGWTLKVL